MFTASDADVICGWLKLKVLLNYFGTGKSGTLQVLIRRPLHETYRHDQMSPVMATAHSSRLNCNQMPECVYN